ncbi:hypothetical protein F2P79_026031 [Pimephales promelas]|nr:hypothetical protein F2P79_026031 [Pimephales promelas]
MSDEGEKHHNKTEVFSCPRSDFRPAPDARTDLPGPEQWLLQTWPISTYYYCASTRPRLNFTLVDSLSPSHAKITLAGSGQFVFCLSSALSSASASEPCQATHWCLRQRADRVRYFTWSPHLTVIKANDNGDSALHFYAKTGREVQFTAFSFNL